MLVHEVITILQRIENSKEVRTLCDWSIHGHAGRTSCSCVRAGATPRPTGEVITSVRVGVNIYALAAAEISTRGTYGALAHIGTTIHREKVICDEVCREGGVTAGSHCMTDSARITPAGPNILSARSATLWRCGADRVTRTRNPVECLRRAVTSPVHHERATYRICLNGDLNLRSHINRGHRVVGIHRNTRGLCNCKVRTIALPLLKVVGSGRWRRCKTNNLVVVVSARELRCPGTLTTVVVRTNGDGHTTAGIRRSNCQNARRLRSGEGNDRPSYGSACAGCNCPKIISGASHE